jgi:anti-anti-sigma regulatory factor
MSQSNEKWTCHCIHSEFVFRRQKMTLRIEKSSEANTTTLRLIGRVQAEHLDELNTQIKNNEPDVTLDLGEVSLVDIDVVRFLGACQSKGVKLTGCSPYIRDWIALELEREH